MFKKSLNLLAVIALFSAFIASNVSADQYGYGDHGRGYGRGDRPGYGRPGPGPGPGYGGPGFRRPPPPPPPRPTLQYVCGLRDKLGGVHVAKSLIEAEARQSVVRQCIRVRGHQDYCTDATMCDLTGGNPYEAHTCTLTDALNTVYYGRASNRFDAMASAASQCHGRRHPAYCLAQQVCQMVR